MYSNDTFRTTDRNSQQHSCEFPNIVLHTRLLTIFFYSMELASIASAVRTAARSCAPFGGMRSRVSTRRRTTYALNSVIAVMRTRRLHQIRTLLTAGLRRAKMTPKFRCPEPPRQFSNLLPSPPPHTHTGQTVSRDLTTRWARYP